MMLKFATPQRLGVPSHCLNTLSQRLIERLIKYIELYRNQREEKKSFPKKLFAEVGPFCEPLEWRVDVNNINSLDNSGSN